MSEQQINTCLSMLKIDLGISTSAYDERLIAILKAAAQAITSEGATLNPVDPLDQQLIVMYSSWLWNKRRTGEGMPRMLRFALNNRVFGEKMGGEA